MEIESVKTTELIEVYHVTEIDSWNEKMKADYREQQGKRNNISHYVKGEKQQGREGEKMKTCFYEFSGFHRFNFLWLFPMGFG